MLSASAIALDSYNTDSIGYLPIAVSAESIKPSHPSMTADDTCSASGLLHVF